MNLSKKRSLAARTLGVGRERIKFVNERLDEIKEIITKQDVRDLVNEKAIIIKNVLGRKKVHKKLRKRGVGKVRKRVNTRKKEYVIITRKLRAYVAGLKENGKIDKETYYELRKKIRAREFHNLAQCKDYIRSTK
jgi:ribosomal protein L19E